MAFSIVSPREICIILMAIGAAVLVLPLPTRVARVLWLVLLTTGIVNAVVLIRQPQNLLQSNVAHYFLGAKYPIPYQNFYKAINAALDRPQVGMRDLTQPTRLVRATEPEQRAYYIDLLRGKNVTFDPLASLDELRQLAVRSGVLQEEARRILSENLPTGQVGDFRRDVRVAASASMRDITDDFGFNGSPLYSLVRHVDPTLYMPFGPATAWLNLAWQCAGVIVFTWLMGLALGLDVNGRLAMAALVFAWWDFVTFALPGLIFAGVWLPIAIALYAMHRRAWAPAGVVIAWAGLIKLFPFILLLPAVARLVRAVVLRVRKSSVKNSLRPWFQLLMWCAVATGVLMVTATLGGRSWRGFFEKILTQFSLGAATGNNVSVTMGLSMLGIPEAGSLLPALLSVVSLATLTILFARGKEGELIDVLPRRCLVLLAALGWVTRDWLNYYWVPVILLMPLLARRHRVGALVALLAVMLTAILPEFDDPLLAAHPVLLKLKLAPYILIPVWLVFIELRTTKISRKAVRFALAACALCVLVSAAEVWRVATVRKLIDEAKHYIDQGDPTDALAAYNRLSTLSPRYHEAYNGKAVAYIMLRDMPRAGLNFARAVHLNPEDSDVRQNYGRFLWKSGRIDEAAQEFEEAHRLAPFDESILLDLARVRLVQRQVSEARNLLDRALELEPSNEAAGKLIEQLEK